MTKRKPLIHKVVTYYSPDRCYQVSKIPKHKQQILNTLQIAISNDRKKFSKCHFFKILRFGILYFTHCYLFVICFLVIVIYLLFVICSL